MASMVRAQVCRAEGCEYSRRSSTNSDDVDQLWLFRRRTRPVPFRQSCDVSKRLDPREEEVSAASHGGEGRQTRNSFSYRTLGDLKFKRAVLVADERIAFVAELVKAPIVHPDVLGELELAYQAPADHEGGDAAFHVIVWCVLGQRRAISSAAADHAAAVHVRRCVAGIHAAHVRA